MEYVSPRGRDASRKATSFATYAKQHGWSGKWSTDDDTGVTHLFARRGENETLDVWWHDGAIVAGNEPVYTLAGERIKLRNLSAAAKTVSSNPNQDRLRKAVRKRKRQAGIEYTGETVSVEGLQGSLPFDDESDDDEIEAVLHKRTITWVNRISGQVDSAMINADKAFKVVRIDGGKDQVHFCDPVSGGYRAVYLNAVVGVG